ncbi:hypothetical protein HaLaN_14262, partial [Haematococcus lacustris]
MSGKKRKKTAELEQAPTEIERCVSLADCEVSERVIERVITCRSCWFHRNISLASIQAAKGSEARVIKVPGDVVLRGCERTKRKILAHLQQRVE